MRSQQVVRGRSLFEKIQHEFDSWQQTKDQQIKRDNEKIVEYVQEYIGSVEYLAAFYEYYQSKSPQTQLPAPLRLLDTFEHHPLFVPQEGYNSYPYNPSNPEALEFLKNMILLQEEITSCKDSDPDFHDAGYKLWLSSIEYLVTIRDIKQLAPLSSVVGAGADVIHKKGGHEATSRFVSALEEMRSQAEGSFLYRQENDKWRRLLAVAGLLLSIGLVLGSVPLLIVCPPAAATLLSVGIAGAAASLCMLPSPRFWDRSLEASRTKAHEAAMAANKVADAAVKAKFKLFHAGPTYAAAVEQQSDNMLQGMDVRP